MKTTDVNAVTAVLLPSGWEPVKPGSLQLAGAKFLGEPRPAFRYVRPTMARS
jgi:hypothetical protein